MQQQASQQKRNFKVDLGKFVQMYRAPFLYLPGAPNSLNPPLGGAMTVEHESGPGLDFIWCFVCGSRPWGAATLLLCLFILLNLFECSPVPASFFPFYELCYNNDLLLLVRSSVTFYSAYVNTPNDLRPLRSKPEPRPSREVVWVRFAFG